MPLLALNDDCLGEIAGWLPAREMVLSFQLACKVLRSVVRADQVDQGIVAEHPFIGGLLGQGRAVVRQAYSDLRRVTRRAPDSYQLTRRAPRTLDEFRFLVAVDDGDFVEIPADLDDGGVCFPWSGLVDAEAVAVYVVVVDALTGRMERLVDGPGCDDVYEDQLFLEWVNFPGQEARWDGDMHMELVTRIDLEENSADFSGRMTASYLSISCRICSDNHIDDGSDEDFLKGIAGMFT
ncbi:hypothetical protein TeGR_g819 [Tetraparma gracilis]|uniref:F-box domain-containing protein n=1 Tax=Tetraparma gracilis TaxID=2962635 RepID=A0ABQ6MD97_9STRA|nr:hypothetical protein TeGR_g819 [Tetraparma gracilis]